MAEYAIPILLAVGTTAYSGISAHQKEVSAKKEVREQKAEARTLAAQQQETWERISKPDPAALEAQATQNRGQLAQARLGSYQNLASNLAARGFGSGSGLAVGGAQNIERGYLQNLGQSATELTKFGLTPQFAPPGSAYGTGPYTATGLTSPAGAMASKGENLMDTALGWTLMKNIYGTKAPAQTSYYDPYNPQMLYAYNYGPSYTG